MFFFMASQFILLLVMICSRRWNPYLSSRDSSPSQQSMETEVFPPDVTKLILARLAPRCLMRFRVVSKSWRDMIDGPDFVKQHLDRSSMPDSGNHSYLHRTIFNVRQRIFTTRFESSGRLTHDELTHHPIPPTQFHMVKIVGSCNGLVCIRNYLINKIILWNPWIRRSYRIPRIRARGYRVPDTTRHIHYGFGYNRSSDDYNVVRLVNHFPGRYRSELNTPICDVHIYSWKKKSWSAKLRNLPYRILTGSKFYQDCSIAGVFAESSIHWLADNGSIVGIDLGSRDYRVFRQPGSLGIQQVLGELGGNLCIVDLSFSVTSLWVMKEYGNVDSWTRILVNVPISGYGAELMRPIRYYKDDKEIVLFNKEQFQSYNLEQQSVVRTADIPGPYHVHEGYNCVESLVRPSVG